MAEHTLTGHPLQLETLIQVNIQDFLTSFGLENVRRGRALLGVEPVSAPPRLVVRGEAYFPIDAFEQFNREQEAAGKRTYANPRNTAAGSLRVLDLLAGAELPRIC